MKIIFSKIFVFYKILRNSKLLQWIANFPRTSIFWYPLILSIFSGLIFYYFFSVLPRHQELKKVKPQIEYLTDKILSDGMFIVTEMTYQNLTQNKYNEGVLTIREIENALQGIYFDTKLRYICVNQKGEWYNIGDFVSDYLSNIERNSEVLFRYIIYLDPEEINIINELLRNDLFETWHNSRFPEIMNIDGQIFKAERKDLSGFKFSLFEFYQALQKLDKYAHEEIYTRNKSLQINAANAYFSNNFKLAIQYNLEILKINKKDKDAMFYYGASLIGDYQIFNGIKVLKKFLELYPDQKESVKSNIKNEYAKKMIFKESD